MCTELFKLKYTSECLQFTSLFSTTSLSVLVIEYFCYMQETWKSSPSFVRFAWAILMKRVRDISYVCVQYSAGNTEREFGAWKRWGRTGVRG